MASHLVVDAIKNAAMGLSGGVLNVASATAGGLPGNLIAWGLGAVADGSLGFQNGCIRIQVNADANECKFAVNVNGTPSSSAFVTKTVVEA